MNRSSQMWMSGILGSLIFLVGGVSAVPARAGFIDVLGVTLKNRTGVAVFAYQLATRSDTQPPIKSDDFAYYPTRRPAGWKNRPVDQAGTLIFVGWTGNPLPGQENVPPKDRVKLGANEFGEFEFTLKGDFPFRAKRSEWLDSDGDVVATTPLPGFQAQAVKLPNDPLITFFNDLDPAMSFGIQNLEFNINVPESALIDLMPDPDTPYDNSLPSFLLNSGDTMDFDIPETIDFGNFLYARGQIVDEIGGEVLGTFVYGIQSVPEPGSLTLALLALPFLVAARWRRWK